MRSLPQLDRRLGLNRTCLLLEPNSLLHFVLIRMFRPACLSPSSNPTHASPARRTLSTARRALYSPVYHDHLI